MSFSLFFRLLSLKLNVKTTIYHEYGEKVRNNFDSIQLIMRRHVSCSCLIFLPFTDYMQFLQFFQGCALFLFEKNVYLHRMELYMNCVLIWKREFNRLTWVSVDQYALGRRQNRILRKISLKK